MKQGGAGNRGLGGLCESTAAGLWPMTSSTKQSASSGSTSSPEPPMLGQPSSSPNPMVNPESVSRSKVRGDNRESGSSASWFLTYFLLSLCGSVRIGLSHLGGEGGFGLGLLVCRWTWYWAGLFLEVSSWLSKGWPGFSSLFLIVSVMCLCGACWAALVFLRPCLPKPSLALVATAASRQCSQL